MKAGKFDLLLVAWFCWLGGLLLGVGRPGLLLGHGTIPLVWRALLLAEVFFLWCTLLFFLFWPAVWLLRRLAAEGRLKARFVRGAAAAGAAAFSLWFGFSWAVYYRTGTFLGVSELAFMRHNAGGLLLYMTEIPATDLLLGPAAAALLAAVLCAFVKTADRLLEGRGRRRFLSISLLMIGLGMAAPVLSLYLPGDVSVLDPQLRTPLRRHELFRYLVHYQSGPGPRLFLDAWDFLARRERAADADDLRAYLTRPEKRRITLPQYVARAGAGPRPAYNVLYILVESLRADRLRDSGALRTTMPNLDRLAEESTVFTRAYSESTHTDYANIAGMSGQYPLRSRSHDYYRRIDYPRLLLHDVLKAFGYRTAVFSSENEGWDNMLAFLDTGGWDTIFHGGNYAGRTRVEPMDSGFAEQVSKGLLRGGVIEDATTLSHAAAWIAEDDRRPFYMFVDLQSSHFPYYIPASSTPLYTPVEIDFRANFASYAKENVPVMLNRYDDSLLHVDARLGKLFDRLRALGLWDKTIVVVSGDHGEAFDEHGFVTHAGPVWNEVLRIPMIVRVPKRVPRRDDRYVQHIDVPPTILSLLGLPPHPSFQGIDMLSPKKDDDRCVYSVAQTGLAEEWSVVSGRYKLIHSGRSGANALYDLLSDPGETRDISPENPGVLARLKEKLRFWHDAQLFYYDFPEISSRYFPPSYH